MGKTRYLDEQGKPIEPKNRLFARRALAIYICSIRLSDYDTLPDDVQALKWEELCNENGLDVQSLYPIPTNTEEAAKKIAKTCVNVPFDVLCGIIKRIRDAEERELPILADALPKASDEYLSPILDSK